MSCKAKHRTVRTQTISTLRISNTLISVGACSMIVRMKLIGGSELNFGIFSDWIEFEFLIIAPSSFIAILMIESSEQWRDTGTVDTVGSSNLELLTRSDRSLPANW